MTNRCKICGSFTHNVEDCQHKPSLRDVVKDQQATIDKLVEALSKATRVIRDLNNHVCVDDIDDVIADLSLLIKSISSKGVKGE